MHSKPFVILASVLIMSSSILRAETSGSIISNVFTTGFEAGTAGWTTSGCWGVGAPLAGPLAGHASTNCAGTRLHGNYPDNANDSLISPAIQLPPRTNSLSTIKLSYYEWLRTESALDRGILEVTTNAGISWIQLSSTSGSSDWRRAESDISELAGATMQIRFRFVSDESLNFDGWYIDDLQIEHSAPAPLAVLITSLSSMNFPYIYMNVTVKTNGLTSTNIPTAGFAALENWIAQTQRFEVISPSENGGARLADIVFLMDNSGSMDDDQAQIASNVVSFVNGLNAQGIDYALGLCRYGQGDNNGYPMVEDNGILTSDANYFKNVVWNRNTTDGGTEPGYDTLVYSCNAFNFRPGARRVFIIITDESPNQGLKSSTNAMDACTAAGATVFALTDPLLYPEFKSVTDATGGQYFNINTNFNAILEQISQVIASSYIVRYRSSDPMATSTSRTAAVTVNYQSLTATNSCFYIPCSAPRIERTAYTAGLHSNAWAAGTPFRIEARIVDQVLPVTTGATLYCKNTGDSAYNALPMVNTAGNLWQASVSNGFARGPGFDYFIMATDGESTTSDPSVDPRGNCYQLAILPNHAPDISHTPVLSPALNTPLNIQATVTDSTTNVKSVAVFYRRTGQLLYRQTQMTNTTGAVYQGTIPTNYVTAEGLDYYIRAFDDQGVGQYNGTPDKPHQTLTPRLDVTPPAMSLSLLTGGTATRYITVSNSISGGGALVFELVPADLTLPGILSFDPLSGYFDEAGKATNVAVRFNASGLTGGTYKADFVVTSNDPDQPRTTVTATMTVTGACDIAASAALIDFGPVFAGCVSTQSLTVSNRGFAALSITSASTDNPLSGVTPPSAGVAAGTSTVLSCTFAPVTSGTVTGHLNLVSNDPDTPVLSVLITGRGVPPPSMTVTPASISTNMPAGTTGIVTITVSNAAGGSPLDLSLSVSSSNASPHSADAFGYSWMDSNDPGGPQFQGGWQDISSVGLTTLLSGGASSATMPLPFTFTYYGKARSTLLVSKFGLLSFGDSPSWYGSPFPTADSENDLIAPYWSYLEKGSGAHYVYNDQPGGRYIVQYDRWALGGGGGEYSFQVQLCRNGDIYYYYKTMTGMLYQTSIGCENSTGETGLQVAYNRVYATNGLAVRISPPGSFLQPELSTARILPGTSRQIQLRVDSSCLTAGSYRRDLIIKGNDPAHPYVSIPFQLSVSGIPDIAVDMTLSTTNIGIAYYGYTCTGLVRIANSGTDILNVTGVASDNPAWVPKLTAFTLAPGGVKLIPVELIVNSTGISTAQLTITSNDPDTPLTNVRLSADRRYPPSMSVAPASISATGYLGTLYYRTVSITNSGAGQLQFSVAAAGGIDHDAYLWQSSDQAGGPAFEWFDISTNGTASSLIGDDNYVSLALPFSFPFFGQYKSTLLASCNGYVTFGSEGGEYSNSDLPDQTEPNDLIAPFWDDLKQGTSGVHYYYHDAARGRFIMQYKSWTDYGATSVFDFQVQLCRNGDIYFFYKGMAGVTNYATTGIENSTGTAGLSLAAWTPFAHSNMAVRISPPRDFLACALTGGVLQAGAGTNFTITLGGQELTLPDYNGELVITGNDPAHPEIRVPVHFDVGGACNSLPYSEWAAKYWPQGNSGGTNNDFDSDGIPNYAEWIAGTDPTHASSSFELTGAEAASGTNFALRWASETNRFYSIDWSSNSMQSWSTLISDIAGSPAFNSYTDSLHGAAQRGYYRIRVRQ